MCSLSLSAGLGWKPFWIADDWKARSCKKRIRLPMAIDGIRGDPRKSGGQKSGVSAGYIALNQQGNPRFSAGLYTPRRRVPPPQSKPE